MSAHAAPPPSGLRLTVRGRSYPVLLPKLSDPRLHLAVVITTLQVLGQVAFDFRLSISQILIAVGTCAVLEFGITLHRQKVLLWPASAMLTGNGVAFVLRVPGTQHGDWWSLNGWYIFMGTAAFALLSKYLIKVGGSHVFNPSNIGLVVCFLLLGPAHAEPLDFWWGPMSPWLAFALIVIVGGGLAILTRLHLLLIAVGFWVSFALGIALLAATGHAMTARWHLGPITGPYFWWVLVTSPEILVFMFFMITDPKTTPKSRRARLIYAVSVGLLAALLIAPAKTEFWSKVAVLGALTIVCGVRPLLERAPSIRFSRRRLAAVAAVILVGYTGAIAAAGIRARPETIGAPLAQTGRLPRLSILPSKGVETVLDRKTARRIAGDLVADLSLQTTALQSRKPQALPRAAIGDALNGLLAQLGEAAGGDVQVPAYRLDRMRVWLERGHGQGAAIAVAAVAGTRQLSVYRAAAAVVRRAAPVPFHQTLELQLDQGRWLVAHVRGAPPAPLPPAPKPSPELVRATAKAFAGVRLTDVASQVGLDFRQGDFRFGTSYDVHSMMGGGLCWLDYNNDGWLDLFVVNSYSDGDVAAWNARGGLPRSALFENVHGRFVNVGARSGADPAVQGNGCVAADFNGDGHTDLLITTNTYNVLLWNNGDGTFTDGTHAAGIDAFGTYGWHTGAAVADVNGDGRPDIFVSGYADVNAPSENSSGGFPLNFQAFRDLLYLNEGTDSHGHSRFKEVSLEAGIEAHHIDHSLGAAFADVNGDGRPDLYVANDLDPNRLYVNAPGGPLGFHFVEEGRYRGVADRKAGMGVAAQDYSGDGRPDLFVTNSRGQGHAAFRSTAAAVFSNAQSTFAPAVGPDATGWGDSWVDLANDGRLDLLLANGAIPVTNLKQDAGPIQVIGNLGGGRFSDASSALGLRPGPLVNGRGIAAADYDNDGRVDIAVNSIGGKLILLRNTGASGHWLEVSLAPLAPGALVTAVLPDGRRLVHQIQAGSSYLSSEDPRVHFGLGTAARVKELIVRWPGGRVTRQQDVAADRIVTVKP
ncbi:MAG TPA: FG-GAP-like repeat-containing protein [Gaiellaceae bacterium]|nr:FG-GAP-like repeat-containing protein [Gaiellaceae bacterium]